MGNDQSLDRNRMAIAAMAHFMKVTKQQLVELRETCLRYSSNMKTQHDSKKDSMKVHNVKIKRGDFLAAMEEVGINQSETDSDVLENLFTMWDKTGDDEVHIVLFLASLSPLASVLGIQTKLEFAFKMMDVHDNGTISHVDMVKLFNGINATASYFGDPVITPSQIEMMCEDILSSCQSDQTNSKTGSNNKTIEKNTISYKKANLIESIVSHPTVIQFANGQGTMRYGTGKSTSE